MGKSYNIIHFLFFPEIYLERQKTLFNSLFLNASECSAIRPNQTMTSYNDLTCNVLEEQSMKEAVYNCVNYELIGLVGYDENVNCSQMEHAVEECGVKIAEK